MVFLTLSIWLSATIKFVLTSLEIPTYVLFPGTSFGFCNYSCVCFANIWSSPNAIIRVSISFLSEYCWVIFLNHNLLGIGLRLVMAFGVLELYFAYYPNLFCSCSGVLFSNHSLFSILISLFWISSSLSIAFNWTFLSFWSFLFSNFKILICSPSNNICSVIFIFFRRCYVSFI